MEGAYVGQAADAAWISERAESARLHYSQVQYRTQHVYSKYVYTSCRSAIFHDFICSAPKLVANCLSRVDTVSHRWMLWLTTLISSIFRTEERIDCSAKERCFGCRLYQPLPSWRTVQFVAASTIEDAIPTITLTLTLTRRTLTSNLGRRYRSFPKSSCTGTIKSRTWSEHTSLQQEMHRHWHLDLIISVKR